MDEELFSIDIHYNKLLDWLLDRRHCDSKWHTELHVVRERLDVALKQLSDVKQLTWIPEQPFLNYFDFVRVFESVKEVDGDSKSLFGQYTSPRVKEWSEILKLYEKNNLYMAECAQQLTRNVNYEIPALKHQISRCQQTQRDSQRKERELTTAAAALREKYETSCKDMGIKGENVKQELAELVRELPGVYEKVLSDLPSLVSPITYYKAFIKHTTKRKIDEDTFLPTLMYVIIHGNVTVYEWKHNEPPPNQNQNGTGAELGSEKVADELEIDWGDIDTPTNDQQTSTSTAGIDFGTSEINFGESEINFDADVDLSAITIEDSGDVDEVVTVAKTKADTSDADLQSLLDNTHTRNLFLDDVMELKEFLGQRIIELSQESSSLLAFGQFDTSEEISMQSVESITEMLGHVTTILTHLTNQRTQHLFLIKGSPRYLERLSESLQQELRLAHRSSSQAAEHAARREEAAELAVSVEPKLLSLIDCVKKLQKQVVADISKRYNNRVVNLIGEINQI